MGDDLEKKLEKIGTHRRFELINFSKRRGYHCVINFIYRTHFFLLLIGHPVGWKFLKDPVERRILYKREARLGLLEDSIIQNPLYAPNEDSTFEYNKAVAGRWCGFDFHRKSELGKDAPQKCKGRLASFLLTEIMHNPKDHYTPTALLNIFDVYHLLHLELPGISYLVETEVIEPKTYREAFGRVGLYEKYARSMSILGITDEEVYQVTPKGNSLIFLISDSGSKEKQKKPLEEMKPVFNES